MSRPIRASLAPAHADLAVPPTVLDPATEPARLTRHDRVRAVLVTPEERHRVLLLPAAGGLREVVVDGWRLLVETEPEARAALRERARRGRPDAAAGGPLEVRAAIPGRVLSVAVAEGETVEVGRPLLVVEAMKMQNELRSSRAGTVRRVAVGAGQTVELGDLLVVLE